MKENSKNIKELNSVENAMKVSVVEGMLIKGYQIFFIKIEDILQVDQFYSFSGRIETKQFYFWKMKKIEDFPLKTQADGQSMLISYLY